MELQSPDHPDGSLAQLPVYMITWVEDKEHTEALRVQCPGVAAEILEREEGECGGEKGGESITTFRGVDDDGRIHG